MKAVMMMRMSVALSVVTGQRPCCVAFLLLSLVILAAHLGNLLEGKKKPAFLPSFLYPGNTGVAGGGGGSGGEGSHAAESFIPFASLLPWLLLE